MNQPRQCPGCKTWYAPHVEKCECGKHSGVVGAIVGPGDVCLPTDKSGNTYTVKNEDIQSYYNC